MDSPRSRSRESKRIKKEKKTKTAIDCDDTVSLRKNTGIFICAEDFMSKKRPFGCSSSVVSLLSRDSPRELHFETGDSAGAQTITRSPYENEFVTIERGDPDPGEKSAAPIVFSSWSGAAFYRQFAGSDAIDAMLARGGGDADADDDDLERERMLNDLTNTGVIATLITGFSYDSWDGEKPQTTIATARTLLMYSTIHIGMLSALASTMVYKRINSVSGSTACALVEKKRYLFMAPHILFVLSVLLFISGVILKGIESSDTWFTFVFYLAIGSMCPIAIAVGFSNMGT